jgi:hypothetical protein
LVAHLRNTCNQTRNTIKKNSTLTLEVVFKIFHHVPLPAPINLRS